MTVKNISNRRERKKKKYIGDVKDKKKLSKFLKALDIDPNVARFIAFRQIQITIPMIGGSKAYLRISALVVGGSMNLIIDWQTINSRS